MTKVVLKTTCSLDGYLIQTGTNLSCFKNMKVSGQDSIYNKLWESVGTLIVGRRTYECIKSQVDIFSNADMDTYIITREMRHREGNIRFYADDPKELIMKRKMKGGKDILVWGGAEVLRMMMRDYLLDELTVSIVPVILGSGPRLFGERPQEIDLELIRSEAFDTGLVQLVYKFKKELPFEKDDSFSTIKNRNYNIN